MTPKHSAFKVTTSINRVKNRITWRLWRNAPPSWQSPNGKDELRAELTYEYRRTIMKDGVHVNGMPKLISQKITSNKDSLYVKRWIIKTERDHINFMRDMLCHEDWMVLNETELKEGYKI